MINAYMMCQINYELRDFLNHRPWPIKIFPYIKQNCSFMSRSGMSSEDDEDYHPLRV